jgi:hypothetical protein
VKKHTLKSVWTHSTAVRLGSLTHEAGIHMLQESHIENHIGLRKEKAYIEEAIIDAFFCLNMLLYLLPLNKACQTKF